MTDRSVARLIVTAGGARHRVRVEPGPDEASLVVLPEPATATSGRGASDPAAIDGAPGETGPGAARRVIVRLVSLAEDTCVVSVDGRLTVVRVSPAAGGGHHAVTGGDSFEVVPDPDSAATRSAADGAAGQTAAADTSGAGTAVATVGAGDTRVTDSPDAAIPNAAPAGGGPGTPGIADRDALCAPMPATVTAILVDPGSAVAAGDTLVRLEAMKMELAIRAPTAGSVRSVDCRVGELVQPGRPLVTLDAADAGAPDTRESA